MTKKSLLASAAVVAALVMLGEGVAQAQVIYKAPADDTNQIGFSGNPGGLSNGPFGVGNTITFAGPDLVSTVDLFGYAGGGSLPIEVDLYSGSDPNAGTLLGSEQVTPTGNGYTTEVFDFHNLAVPNQITFIISIVGNTGSYDDSFVNWQQFTGNASAPTVGASGDTWYGSPGGYVVDNNYAVDTGAMTNTLAVQFNAPEPATWAMLGLGFAALGFVGYRKTREARAISL